MNPNLTINLVRALFVAFTTWLGFVLGAAVLSSALVGMLAGAAFGLTIVLTDRLLKGVSLRLFSSATFGLLMGAIFAKLLLASGVLKNSTEDVQWIASLLVYATCAYLGTMLAVRSNREDFSLVIPYVRFRESSVQDAPLLLDSSIIIDGRVKALCATGFLSSSFVVPRFILEELQQLADSADPLKRERGHRALARLQEMQRDPALIVSIHEGEARGDVATDMKLVQLARLLDARLLTNDANLCAVARLQGVSPLNLHDLARGLRPSLDIGDEIELELTKEGRDAHQAVGYLADGTMIVTNHARERIGQTVLVTIASALQTSAGRLLFAELAFKGRG
jgi:uncharacterized protein YacL